MSEPSADRAPDQASDAALDAAMDRTLMDSFPASDPPQWDSLASHQPVVRKAGRSSEDCDPGRRS
ncbi:MAG TPA: hypothetical protein VKB80_00015 [Kofleriaceae bacterium]|nr:hypothetical protein [Kofleriaceae bacterium]